MAFWNKKTLLDIINKHFKEKSISLEKDNELYSFTLSVNDFTLYPYFKINDDYISMIVNINKVNNNDELYKKINNFNLKSKFFTMKYKDSILFLEYNFYAVNDNIIDIIDEAISSLNSLGNEIDKF